ncbi:MAG: 6,7-dimethyl-8-ribityllumazine synthase [Candidatus Omnitrophica bacterium]|nr:6,7-dimethyl-8-ribityllumazine synthase [Candidatus Omnitrophota bacterium]
MKNKKYAVVASRFNEFITQRLLEGCLGEFARRGVPSKNVQVVWVPGAFEIPVVALKLAKQKSIAAVICLGAVIRGETIHFELVAKGAARGITQAALIAQKPIIFGVIATDTVNQAYARSESKGDNKGKDAAATAIEMANIIESIGKKV